LLKVLVTGATGFIGQHVLSVLSELDIEIHGVSRRLLKNYRSTIWHQIDLLNVDQARNLFSALQPTHLLHLAWNVEHKSYWSSVDNYRWVATTLHLLEAFHNNGGERAVMAGTCAEYDWSYGYCVEGITPLQGKSAYSICKSNLYKLATGFAAQAGICLAWGRIFFPFGPYENPNRLIPYVIQSLLRGEEAETSHGEQIRDLIYVEDLATMFVKLLNNSYEGPVNLCSGDPVRLKEIIRIIAQTIGRPDLVKLGARSAMNEPPLLVGDTRKLFEEIGYKPKFSLREGIQHSVHWWKGQLDSL
jgi:nucleoside-diphosphate-sugar epimerase